MMTQSRISTGKKQTLPKYPLCACNGHKQEPMNQVCCESSCKQKGLICSICKSTIHLKHETIPLKMFIKMFEDFEAQMDKFSSDKVTQQLDSMYQNVLVSLRKGVERLTLAVKAFQQDLIRGFKSMVAEVVESCANNKQIFGMMEEIKSNRAEGMLINTASLLAHLTHDPKDNKIHLDNRGQVLIREYKDKSIQLEEVMSHWEFNAVNALNTARKVNIENKPTGPKFAFSNYLKANIIKTNNANLVARQTQSNNGDLRFALVEPLLPLDKPSQILFSIKNMTSCIGVGICLKKTIHDKKFKFTYTTIGHGSFLISTNGYTWSHSRADDNIKQKAFQFNTGAKVLVKFDPMNNRIVYTQTVTNQSYEQMIDLTETEKSGGINFCVNLCSFGDEVKIINTKDQ